MMDFDHKEDVMARIKQNGTIQELLLQYQQIALQTAQALAMTTGNPADQAYADQIADGIMQANQLVMPQTNNDNPLEHINSETSEASHVQRARNQARESTQAE